MQAGPSSSSASDFFADKFINVNAQNIAPDENEPPKSMTEILLAPLERLQLLSHTLFLSLSPAQNKPPPPPEIEELLKADAALSVALQQTRIHQLNQRRIEVLSAEVLDLEVRLREAWEELAHGKRELEEMIVEGEERIKAASKAKEGAT